MPRRTRPRRGSLQYWPRKRAKRIYPRVHWHASKEAKPLGFAGWKTGMTHVQYNDVNAHSPTYNRLVSSAVTILDCPPLLVCGIRFYKNSINGIKTVGEKWMDKLPENLRARVGVQKGKDAECDDVNLIVSTLPEKSGMKKSMPDVFEVALGGDMPQKLEHANMLLGKEISAKDIFRPGEYIDVCAVTKGKGFQGPVKRFGVKIKGRKSKHDRRHTGSIGPTTPGHVMWTVPQAGQMGFHTRTEYTKRIVSMGDDIEKVMPKGGFLGYGIPKTCMLVEGSLPGSRKRLIILKKAERTKKFEPVELKYISQESKQGK